MQTQGGVYNAQNPRPWWVTVLGDGDVASVRGIKDLSQQAAPVAPAPSVPQAPPVPQPTYAPQPVLQYQQPAPVPSAPVEAYNVPPIEQLYDQDIPF